LELVKEKPADGGPIGGQAEIELEVSGGAAHHLFHLVDREGLIADR
jgi:hypothetical protein